MIIDIVHFLVVWVTVAHPSKCFLSEIEVVKSILEYDTGMMEAVFQYLVAGL